MPVPPLSSSLVNFSKLDGGNSNTFSRNSRDTILPCKLPVSIVHFAIFVIGCLSVSCRLETTWTGIIQGDGHEEKLLLVYIQDYLAEVMAMQSL
jgi:hypothetical protein